jgi:hypothetical protein
MFLRILLTFLLIINQGNIKVINNINTITITITN